MPDESIIRNNLSGIPSIRGTRLTVYNIMDHHLAGQPAAWIAEFFRISVTDAHAAKEYIDAHLDELTPKYERDLEWTRRGNPSHVQAMFSESHKKLMRLKEEAEHAMMGKT